MSARQVFEAPLTAVGGSDYVLFWGCHFIGHLWAQTRRSEGVRSSRVLGRPSLIKAIMSELFPIH